ncbi:MAG TPA: UrcA family protein [Steroidobacteraceae bacterium]|jgi:UrcA family protein|nr:UrcA family protein [Steroidobacteraceae bacterium]
MNRTIRTKLHTAIYCTLGAAALCIASASVQAEEALPSKTVQFADLNITSEAGAKVLYSRIRAAARDVCHDSSGGDPILRLGVSACIAKAVDKAVKDVNSPVLTSLRFGSGDVRLASK